MEAFRNQQEDSGCQQQEIVDALSHAVDSLSVSAQDMNNLVQQSVPIAEQSLHVDNPKSTVQEVLDALAFNMPAEVKTSVMEALAVERFADVIEICSKSEFGEALENILNDSCTPEAREVLKPILREAIMHKSTIEMDVFDRTSQVDKDPGILIQIVRIPGEMSAFCQQVHHLKVPTQVQVGLFNNDFCALSPRSVLRATRTIHLLKEHFGNLRTMALQFTLNNDGGGHDDSALNGQGKEGIRSGTCWRASCLKGNETELAAQPGGQLLQKSLKDVVGDMIDAARTHKPARKHYFKLVLRRGPSMASAVAYWEFHCDKIEIDDESRSASQIIDAAMATVHVPNPG